MKQVEKDQLFNDDIRFKEWLGEIIDSNDPLKHYRCKIRVFGLLDEINDEHIPWFFPGNNLSFSSTDGGFGSCSYPKEGTIVKVRFPFGDIYSGEFFGIQNINETLMNEVSNDYKNSHAFVYDVDEELKILYTQSQGLLLKLKDSLVQLRKDKSVLIQSEGTIVHIKNGSISLGNENTSDEPAVLGDKNEDFWKDFLDDLGKVTAITTPGGPTSPISTSPVWAAFVSKWKAKLPKLKSNTVTLNK